MDEVVASNLEQAVENRVGEELGILHCSCSILGLKTHVGKVA